MDKKKKIIALSLFASLFFSLLIYAETKGVKSIEFCDREYEYGIGNDTIKLYFNLIGADGKRTNEISSEDFKNMFYFYEDGKEIENWEATKLSSGVRIPKEYTFSILLDQTIAPEGKKQIFSAVKEFVSMAPDSTIYISFYGDKVSNSYLASKKNLADIENEFMKRANDKALYSGVYAKLAEFMTSEADLIGKVIADNYVQNSVLSRRAAAHPEKNILMVFAEGSRRPMDEEINYMGVTDFQDANKASMPKAYAFYYIADGEDPSIELMLNGITGEKCKPASNMETVLAQFQQSVENATYDFMLAYRASKDKIYVGNVNYTANYLKDQIGEATFTIGSAERPWPEKEKSATGMVLEYIVAILVTILTFAFFFLIMKVAVPYFRSLAFKSKYYKKYDGEKNVKRKICHYCKQDIRQGQIVVTKCSHLMHKHCWEENGYKCAEYGQNCKTGIQEHVDWKQLFTWNSIKECSQTIAGILAGLLSWIIYEICGRGGFSGLSKFIVGLVFDENDAQQSLINDCVTRTSSFLMIGLLLGFFISLIFRYKDEIRDKTWQIWAKIVGLSLLSAAIGMLAFAIGADLFCLILTWSGKSYIPWYCALPAYVLFSISVSLSLTIKSTIPVRSALLGGLCSAIIGFLVLYFTKFTSANYSWLNMLLDFIIYGGGLGASLVTVRMLAEKYFLVIQNGIKAGQRIPIHKWMNATGGGNKVSIGMTGDCEIQMNWEKSNKVAKEHATLFIDPEKSLPVIKPLATGVTYNNRAELPVNRVAVLTNGDTFKIGDTIFKYEEI